MDAGFIGIRSALRAAIWVRAFLCMKWRHYNDVMMTTMASQITSLTIIYFIVYSDVIIKEKSSV